tara:strand:+ start:30944 stop:31252 length:309 start_codon:yes stop_codon:yes gene_type:complete
MNQNSNKKNIENIDLFNYLIKTFQTSGLIALGQITNPITSEINKNLDQASFYIELLKMINIRMKESLTDYEEQLLINTISELRLIYLKEIENKTKTKRDKDL